MSLGLLGTLELARRSLENNRQSVELTGHNLANVSNPAYARQRVQLQTSETVPGNFGPQGTGASITGFEQLRNALLDRQITAETSVTHRLEAEQQALQLTEANLGQQLNRASTALGVSGQLGMAEGISEFFIALQGLSAAPHSTADRQVLLLKAESLTEKFNSVDQRLQHLHDDLNRSIESDVGRLNSLIREIASLSHNVTGAELGSAGNANDVRDRRQLKLEELAGLANITYSTGQDNTFDLFIGGVEFISGNRVVDSVSAASNQGAIYLQSTATADPVTLTGGRLQGVIQARDGAIATLRSDLNHLASTLISEVNQIHQPGFALDGASTGQLFFTGANASDIRVNSVLKQNPQLIQASATGEPGNNEIALALAQLGSKTLPALNGLTVTESYNQTIAGFGQSLSNVNTQLLDQQAVDRMLLRQRDSLGGVSIDEEMANLVIYQRAFQASARMINILDDLLQNVISMGR